MIGRRCSSPLEEGMSSLRILIATDAWHPQVNGVVRTLEMTAGELRRLGHDVRFVTPEGRFTIPCPTYPDIRLTLAPRRMVAKALDDFQPDAIHIATEGPIGLAMRSQCLKRGLVFTTAYHTRFPDYVHARLGIPRDLAYRYVRWFHKPSAAVMVTTNSVEAELSAQGITRLKRWSRGVDMDLFSPAARKDVGIFGIDGADEHSRPIFLYVGRVATEKNLDAFLRLDLPGHKIVVGDGPERIMLESRYPHVRFLGALHGQMLAQVYASADVFVFPSKTDTFGLVILEALASGLPVAAFPVPGPLDIIGQSTAGVLSQDLGQAALDCLRLDRSACRAHADLFSWGRAGAQFLDNLVLATDGTQPALRKARTTSSHTQSVLQKAGIVKPGLLSKLRPRP
jgi:glycosyltransferase involved in cell wall biosynthesis